MRRVLLFIFGSFLMILGFSMIMASNLSTVKNFGTFPYLIIFICGAYILNFEFLVLLKEKIHVFALLSFIFSLVGFSIVGVPIDLGPLTRPFIIIFSLASLILGISFVIMNKIKTNIFKGNLPAFTGVLISAFLLIVISASLLYNPGDHYSLGMNYYNAGKFDQAIKEYDEAIKEESQFIDAYYARGLAYAKKGNYDDAISDFNREIDSFFRDDPNNAQVYLARAEAYLYKHEYEKAWADVHKAEELGYAVNPELINRLKEVLGRDK